MDSFFTFANGSPIVALLMVACAAAMLGSVTRSAFALMKVVIRGWPPADVYCDCDAVEES